jgi:hypothetical protein
MTQDEIIRMAQETGFWREHINAWMCSPEELERFYTLATDKEREARQAAQIENEELKARLARAGLEQQRAVLAEREACAKVAERHGVHPLLNVAFGGPDWYKARQVDSRRHSRKEPIMTDRELLELAAKAAGIELWHEDVFTNGLTQKVNDNGVLRWHPLTDDGDALRLAVKLGLLVSIQQEELLGDVEVHIFPEGRPRGKFLVEPLGSDPYAATRRAIVRAAAEIGRSQS